MEMALHGADPAGLYEIFDLPMPEKILDFSTNTNCLPFTGDIKVDFDNLIANYPDLKCQKLKKLLAEVNNCQEEEILCLNGSNEGIYLLLSYYQNGKIGLYQPCYGEYARAALAYQCQIYNFFDFDDLNDDWDLVFICNPCNPTGQYLSTEFLQKLIRNHHRIKFLIDEAYLDFLPQEMPGLDFRNHQNLYILRSLTKTYHLSGLRCGYLLSDEENIKQLSLRQPSWSLNHPAQAIAPLYLQDQTFLKKTRAYYAQERRRVVEALADLGYQTEPSQTNFFLLACQDDWRLLRFLLQRGIVLRHTRNFPGLDGRYLRIGLRLPEENDYLLAQMAEFAQENLNG